MTLPGIPDPFSLLIAAIVGAILYAIAIRFIPGRQPGEDKIEALIARLTRHADPVPAAPAAAPAAPQPSPPAASPASAAPAPVPAPPPKIAAAPVAVPAAPAPPPPTAPAAAPAPARNPASNAPPGFLDTSPEGYPLFYPLDRNRQPVGAPWLVYDGSTWASVAEIEAYKAAVAARVIANASASYSVPAWTGAIAATSLSVDDWCWVLRHDAVAWHTIIGGDWDYVRGQLGYAFYNGNASFRPEAYTGPLKQFA